MADDIQNYELKWNQHVFRMPENRITTQSTVISTTRKKGLRKILPSLERPVYVVSELELITQNYYCKKKKKNKDKHRR